MPACCVCGKKTLNCSIRDKKAYCKSCLKTVDMDNWKGANKSVTFKISEEIEPILEFKGKLGKIELYTDKVVIKRGVLHASGRSQKEIYLSSITAIQVKKPGLQTGYIQFILAGSQEVKKSGAFGMEIAKDENTVMFDEKAKYEEVLAFKNKIEEMKYKNHQSPVVIQNEVSVADELLKLKALVDAGVLTEGEFDQQKDKLLRK